MIKEQRTQIHQSGVAADVVYFVEIRIAGNTGLGKHEEHIAREFDLNWMKKPSPSEAQYADELYRIYGQADVACETPSADYEELMRKARLLLELLDENIDDVVTTLSRRICSDLLDG